MVICARVICACVIRWAATSVTVVRVQSISLNLDQSEASVSLAKVSFLAFTGEIHQNNRLFYTSERRCADTRRRTSDVCFSCPDSLQFHRVQPSFLANLQALAPDRSRTGLFLTYLPAYVSTQALD